MGKGSLNRMLSTLGVREFLHPSVIEYKESNCKEFFLALFAIVAACVPKIYLNIMDAFIEIKEYSYNLFYKDSIYFNYCQGN